MASPVVRDSTLRSHCESVERVITAMRDQMDQPMTLQQMARIGFASRYHFNRTFRQITGVPPLQFLYALRIDAARRLLTQTQKKVIDICYEVGYNSIGSFTRRFVDVMGVSPTNLRKLARNRNGASAARLNPHTGGGAEPGAQVEGYIHAPEDFCGRVAVGLFTTPIPQGKPVSCAMLEGAGPYSLEGVPEGEFYLFAVGLTHSPAHGSACFDHASALRAGGQPIRFAGNSIRGDTSLTLRPPSQFDPPVLLVVPQEKLQVV